MTEQDIKRIQAKLGVTVDGVLGPQSLKALFAALGITDATDAPSGRQLGNKGVALIKEFESLRLKAYPDPATGGDPWTIGVGHTGPDVHPGLVITEAQADELLRKDVQRFVDAVNKLAPAATQNQFDAMVSLAFNVGEGNLAKSTLLKKHNAGDYDSAALQFAAWNKAAGKVMAGLTRRRSAEAMLYRSTS